MTVAKTIYSCLHIRYVPSSANSTVSNQRKHYVETEFYGEACLYHALGYSVICWPEGNQPSRAEHMLLVSQARQGNGKFHSAP